MQNVRKPKWPSILSCSAKLRNVVSGEYANRNFAIMINLFTKENFCLFRFLNIDYASSSG